MRKIIIRLVIASLAIGFVGATAASAFANPATPCATDKEKDPK